MGSDPRAVGDAHGDLRLLTFAEWRSGWAHVMTGTSMTRSASGLGLLATSHSPAANRFERPAGLGALEITITPRGTPDVDTARRYTDLGVHRLAIQPHTMDGSAMDALITTVGERLVGRV